MEWVGKYVMIAYLLFFAGAFLLVSLEFVFGLFGYTVDDVLDWIFGEEE